MGTRKEMTIGITINLDNYENIRFDLKGEVESDEDVSELTGFLDGVLARIGRGDEVTAERIDHYRRRVFGSLHSEEVKDDVIIACPVTSGKVEEISGDDDLSGIDAPDPIPFSPESPHLEEVVSPVIESDEIAPSEKEEVLPAKQSGGIFVCEACGEEVNKVQHDVSHLFMNKTLCKKCMNNS